MKVEYIKHIAYRVCAVRESFPKIIFHLSPFTVIPFSRCKDNTFLREFQILGRKVSHVGSYQNSSTSDCRGFSCTSFERS